MRHAKKILVVLTLCVMMSLVLAGCGTSTSSGAAAADGSLQKVLDSGQLVLGLDADFAPMGFTDESGDIVGFDIDMAQEVCNRLGVDLIKQSIDWNEKEGALNEGRIDCIWNGLSVTPARAEAMSLTDPYMKNELIFIVPGNSDVKALSDLKGRKVGVQSGSTAQETLEASSIYPDIEVMARPTVTDLVDLMDKGEIAAALVDSVSAYHLILSTDETHYILPESLAEENYAIGFRKGDLALRDRVQEIISDMKADGTLGKISKKWFGSDITTVR